MAMDKQRSWNVGYWVVAILALLALQSWWQATQRIEVVPYSEFEKSLKDGKVSEVVITDQAVTGQLKTPEGRKTAIAYLSGPEPLLDSGTTISRRRSAVSRRRLT